MLSLLSTPTAAQSPSTMSSGILAQLSSTSKVQSPLPSRSAIAASRCWKAFLGALAPGAVGAGESHDRRERDLFRLRQSRPGQQRGAGGDERGRTDERATG